MYGAEIIAIDGNFDDALKIVRSICEKAPIALVNSVNPYRIEGQKTAAFEICEQLGSARTYWRFLLEMPGTSQPTGKASRNITRTKELDCLSCVVLKQKAQRQSFEMK